MQTRLFAIFAALFAAIALIAGCSSSSEDSGKELPDAATLLQESSETTKSQTSVHLKLTVQGEIKELPIETLEGDLTNAPAVAAQGKANLLFLGQKLDDISFVVAEGNLFATLTSGSAVPGLRARRRHLRRVGDPQPRHRAGQRAGRTSPIPRPTAARPSTASRPSASPATSAPTRSTRSLRRSAPPGPFPAPRGFAEDGNHELVQAKLEPSPGNSITMTTIGVG